MEAKEVDILMSILAKDQYVIRTLQKDMIQGVHHVARETVKMIEVMQR